MLASLTRSRLGFDCWPGSFSVCPRRTRCWKRPPKRSVWDRQCWEL